MVQLAHASVRTTPGPTVASPRDLRYLEVKVRLAALVQNGVLEHDSARSISGLLAEHLSRMKGIPHDMIGDSVPVTQDEIRRFFIDVLGAKGAQAFTDFTNGLPLVDPLSKCP